MKVFGGIIAGMAGCVTLFLGFIFIVVAVGAASVGKGEVQGVQAWAPVKKAGASSGDQPLLILKPDWKFDRTQYGSVYVTGRVVNKAGRTLRYAEIKFALKDESGAHIGTAWTNTTALPAGATWKFRAHVLEDDRVRRANLAELSGR